MKTIIKLFYILAAILVAITVVPYNDPAVAFGIDAGIFALLSAAIIPAKYQHSGNLNVITDVKVWEKYIIEKLRKVNDFLMKSTDDSPFVLGGAVVYIPQAGSDPTVEVNTSTYPGVAVQRADSDVNYALDRFRTVPTHVAWEEIQTISYDKIDSVIKGHTNVLAEAVGDVMLINWSPTVAGKQLATTGDDVAAVSTQTGTRKGFDHKDLKRAMIAMNVANVPKKGRVALIDDNMYEYFYDSLTAAQFNAFNQFADNASGIVGRLHGFDIMSRSSVLAYANASATCKAYGSALAATDNLASLCWHPDMVARAIGETKPFQRKDDPLYYGDIWSMIMRAGGRKLRSDNNGVIAVVQGQ
jgi:hypothetical protein